MVQFYSGRHLDNLYSSSSPTSRVLVQETSRDVTEHYKLRHKYMTLCKILSNIKLYLYELRVPFVYIGMLNPS